jgi:hypothetical protein
LTTLVLIYEVSFATVVIFMVGNAFFNPAIRICYTSYMYRLMSELPSGGSQTKVKQKIESQLIIDGEYGDPLHIIGL